MKSPINYPITTHFAAGVLCMIVMLIIDYKLGAKAEFLNAWSIVTQLFGADAGASGCLAIKYFGLPGATILMLIACAGMGALIVGLSNSINRIIKF